MWDPIVWITIALYLYFDSFCYSGLIIVCIDLKYIVMLN